jgi:ATP-dependent Clp protease ATP-binding subunit ClpA
VFERFTGRSKRVVVLAREEAGTLNHNYIGTEHILLGLIDEGGGVGALTLESLGISLEAVRQQVKEIIGVGRQAQSGRIPFTPRTRKVLELSLREALQLGHNYIGTEHILLGLIREGEGVAAQVLVRFGADLDRARQRAIVVRQSSPETEPLPAAAVGALPSVPAAARPVMAWPGEVLGEVVRRARAEAGALRRGYVGTEHLLLALLVAGEWPQVLRDLLGELVTVDDVREQIVRRAGRGGAVRPDAELTPEAGDALDLARCVALADGAAEVEPAHLAAALIGAERSLAWQVLRDQGQRAAATAG